LLLQLGSVQTPENVIHVIDNVTRKLAVIISHVYVVLSGVGFVEQSTKILGRRGIRHIRKGAGIMHNLQVGYVGGYLTI
jgi:hypothetical protein